MDGSAPSLSPHSLSTPRTIILVEDQTDLRLLLKRIVERKGYICLEASTGLAVLSMISPHPALDLILFDYQIPEMDGLQLLQALRLNPFTHNIPFILISVNRANFLHQQALREGAFAILSKPFCPRGAFPTPSARDFPSSRLMSVLLDRKTSPQTRLRAGCPAVFSDCPAMFAFSL